jgi:hypothetical protein
MIIDLLALLIILATGAVVGILLTIRHYEHRRAELQADEERLADVHELLAAWARLRKENPGGREPSAIDSRDRLPI